MIRTPDQRLRVFVSSTLGELADERGAVRRAIERLRLSPVMFELGARPHPPRELYRAYLDQSHVFVGIYWQRYGWIAPGEQVSGLEDEYRLAGRLPQLVYIKEPAPDREPALRALLDDVRSRDRTSYRRFATSDELEELVAEDLAVLLSERFEEPAAAAAAPRPRAPAPVPPTPTIGRAADVAAVTRLLDDGARMVTVTGPGGVGKTRVALEVARALDGRPDRPVHYVALAAVSTPSLALPTVADHLGARGATTRGPLDALVEFFGSARAVLVLDNLEQVLTVRGALAQLLERAPGLQVLATSRQALRIRAEREVPVGPLGVPTSGAVADIARSDAVQLFLDRARALGRPLELDAGTAAAVAELCRRLDGLPLAIELAASRLRLLSPQALLERLGSVLDLPGAGADLPDRQRTLRATLDWSHQLLGEPERRLFARLGVFGGGATLDAVEAVCGDDDDAVLEALAGLLDQSLVLPGDPGDEGAPRVRMLEPVRAYAVEQLGTLDEADEIRRRHLEHIGRLGRRAQPFLCGPDQREWAGRFDAERANLRLAVETGLRTGATATVLRLVWDTLVYHYIRDAIDEPRGWLRTLRDQPANAVDDEVQTALLQVGLVIVGDPPSDPDPGDLLMAAGRVFDEHGLPLEAAVSCHHLGLHRWQAGDAAAAVAALTTSSRRYAAIDHDWGVATVELTLGAVRAAAGDAATALDHHRTALDHARRIDNRPQVAQALQGIALVHAREGSVDAAVAALREAVGIVVADLSVTGATSCLDALSAVALDRGDPELAARCIGAAQAVRRRLAVPQWTAAADAAAPTMAAVRAALPAGRFAQLGDDGARGDLFGLLRDGLAVVAPSTAVEADPRDDAVEPPPDAAVGRASDATAQT